MTPMSASLPDERRRLALRVIVGLIAGAFYDLTDAWLDARVESGRSTRFHAFAVAHEIVDLVLPVVAGALIGLAIHYLELRAAAAAESRRRIDELRQNLHKVERDQAVWVIAASLLHDVRTPLHALGLLLDEVMALPTTANDERAALLMRARLQADRLFEHLGALRSLPAAHKPDLPSVDVSAVVMAFAAQAAMLTPPDPIRIQTRAESAVLARANTTYIQIILENLVANSLDALRERGGPGVTTIELGRENGRLVLRVSDDGPGLDSDAAKTVFEPLRSTKLHGLGIGLSIARALARAMAGDLVVEQTVPATFRLDVPLSEAP